VEYKTQLIMKQEIINRVKEVIATYNQKVEKGLSSIFAQDDVTLILDEIVGEVETKINELEIQVPTSTPSNDEELFTIDDIRKAIDNIDFDEYIEIDNCRFGINYGNEVELEDYDKNFQTRSFKTDLIESVRIEREERKDSESSPLDDSIPANETTSVSTITIVNTSSDSQVDAYNENNQQ